eukprot:TRINITY_DN11730_c0_g1_i3.p1 TRINITY_DN11730_c0_g1~~TRINITY_DN11730_c0_g1_i3.p1  ORF type:complete len:269 (-),score=37.40 TRINITY_DN11730_c0_g1_i3:16-822(-)
MKRNELSDVNRETQISFSLIPLGNSPVPPGRQGHAWAVHGQHLYVFGGRIADTRTGSKSTRTIVNDLWRFNLDGFQWELVESLGEVPSPRHNHTALAYQDKIWVFGGTGGDHIFNELLAFDLKNNTWQLLHPANTALIRGRHGHSASLATLKDSTKMVIFGGGLWEDNRRVYLKEVLLYDFKENSWEVLECAGSVPLGRSFHSANVLGGPSTPLPTSWTSTNPPPIGPKSTPRAPPPPSATTTPSSSTTPSSWAWAKSAARNSTRPIY